MKIERRGDSIVISEIRSIHDLEQYWYDFPAVWRQIKKICGTRAARPKSIILSEKPERLIANDYELARRIAIDLNFGNILADVHVSTGECAINAGNLPNAVDDLPKNAGLIDCTWSDYYRYFSMRVQVPPGQLTKFFPEEGNR